MTDETPAARSGERLIPPLIDEIAATDPDRVFISVPRTAAIPYGFHDFTYAELARGINACAWWMEESLGRSETHETLNYVGPQDMRYVILLFAAIKTGYQLFLSSPWNSAEAHVSLLDSLKCTKILVPEVLPPTVEQVLASRKEFQAIPIQSLQVLLDPDPVPLYPYTKTFAEARLDTFVVLHTSGSTGFPKPVFMKHGLMAQHDTFLKACKEGERPIALSKWKGLRVFLGLGLFHSAAICSIAYAIYSGTTIVIPSPLTPGPMDAQTLNLIHVHGRLDASFVSPNLLIQIANNPKYLENIQNLKYLSYGGGPLPQETGNVLSKCTHVFQNFGATETGYFALQLNDTEDWEYMSFSPQMGCEIRPFVDTLYEFHFVRKPELQATQGVFCTFPELEEYSTKDLFSKHPTKEGLWKFEGRSDDVIVCSTGQKVNPLPIEGILNAHPEVVAASVCGQSRVRVSLLIEPKDPHVSREVLLQEIWPAVERANEEQPVPGRITKSLVLFTEPGKPMVRAGKATVLRKMTEQLYKEELDKMYAAFAVGE